MIDNTFTQALHWFFLNHVVMLYGFSFIIALLTVVSLLKILRVWGD